MIYGRSSTAPCGHPGEHVIGQYVRCLTGCDSVAPKVESEPATGTSYMIDCYEWYFCTVPPGGKIPGKTLRYMYYSQSSYPTLDSIVRRATHDYSLFVGDPAVHLRPGPGCTNPSPDQHLLVGWWPTRST